MLAIATILVFLAGLTVVLIRTVGDDDATPTATTAPTTTTVPTTVPSDDDAPNGAGPNGTAPDGTDPDGTDPDGTAGPGPAGPGTPATTAPGAPGATTTTTRPAPPPGDDEVAAPPSGLGADDAGAARRELADTGAPAGSSGLAALVGVTALAAGWRLRRFSSPPG